MQRRLWTGFSALCILSGSEWIANLVAPRVLPGMFGFGLRMLVLAFSFMLCSRRRSNQRASLRLAFWGALLFVPLPLAFAAAGGHVSSLNEFLALAFLPAGVTFLQAQLQGPIQILERLLPSLVGAAGAALLIAYTIPATIVGRVLLLAIAVAVLLTSLAVVQLRASLRHVTLFHAATVVCAGTAGTSLLASIIVWNSLPSLDVQLLIPEMLRLAFLDAPVILLTVWTLRVLAPTQFSVKYLLTLFIALAESFLVARPEIDWAVTLGSALMLGASFSLLRRPVEKATSFSLFEGS